MRLLLAQSVYIDVSIGSGLIKLLAGGCCRGEIKRRILVKANNV